MPIHLIVCFGYSLVVDLEFYLDVSVEDCMGAETSEKGSGFVHAVGVPDYDDVGYPGDESLLADGLAEQDGGL